MEDEIPYQSGKAMPYQVNPLHYFGLLHACHFLPPASTHKDLDKICNNFLWGDSIEGRKIHLVRKILSFLPKEYGGLGIRSQKLVNQAYMAKLGWKVC